MFELVPRRWHRSPRVRPREDLFNWLLEDFKLTHAWAGDRQWQPAFDISERDEGIIVKAELPGINVKDIDITLTNGLLTIKGERKVEKEDQGDSYRRIERRFGSFSRSFNLGVEVKADAIDASYRDGILTVTLPKAEETKAKRVEVKR